LNEPLSLDECACFIFCFHFAFIKFKRRSFTTLRSSIFQLRNTKSNRHGFTILSKPCSFTWLRIVQVIRPEKGKACPADIQCLVR
jgi:hypothetical protein